MAGDNRSELEVVLSHYADDPSKLMAAEFLIKNMPGHYSITDDMVDGYYSNVDEAYPDVSPAIRRTLYSMIPYHMPIPLADTKQDIHYITADFLITHIDNAFRLREAVPSLKSLPFSEWCEVFLPYRIDSEPLDHIVKDNRLTLYVDSVEVYKKFNFLPWEWLHLASQTFIRPPTEVSYELPSPVNLIQNIGECNANARHYYLVYQQLGIASAIDFVPEWHNKDGRHMWTSTRTLFGGFSGSQHGAKIYRKTYSHNPYPIPNGKDYIPPIFLNPFIKDVTGDWPTTADISVKLTANGAEKPDHMYLAVFNSRSWSPVAWAKIKNKKAEFTDMGRNIAYQPIYYNGNRQKYSGCPFIIKGDGSVKKLTPDHDRLVSMELSRKYTNNIQNIIWKLNLQGTAVFGSDNPDFASCDTVGVIGNDVSEFLTPYCRIDNMHAGRYRYLKVCKPMNKDRVDIADISIYSTGSNSCIEIDSTMHNVGESNYAYMFDRDKLSYAYVPDSVVIDLKRPEYISHINITPRNDDNDIVPGEEYELFYMDANGWKSAGRKVAESYVLKFDNIPSNAMYRLMNHTRGHEERPFTCDDGVITFW